MKIVHVNVFAKKGGAGIAAYRLHKAMLTMGIDSSMLVADNLGIDPSDLNISKLSKIQNLQSFTVNILERILFKLFGAKTFWALGYYGVDISKHPLIENADFIFLHWINEGMLSARGIKRVLKLNKPVYWFMHDMWAMTGGCHYSFDCEGYKMHCGNCPLLGRFKHKWDLSYFMHKAKFTNWRPYRNLHVIAPSEWLIKCAKQSSIFDHRKGFLFRNVLDLDIFKPLDQNVARVKFNLPSKDKKLILFGADSLHSPYKGWSFLLEALKIVCTRRKDIECVIFGSCDPKELFSTMPLSFHYIGRLTDENSIALIYNAVDVLVVPSLADNFPNIIAESLACGTPVVGFEIGGIPELILHKNNGYVAKYKDSVDLVNGIEWVLDTNGAILSENCRSYALSNLSTNVIQKYLEQIL